MKVGEVVNTVVNVGVVLVLAFVLFKPGGLARTAIEKRRAEAHERSRIERAWPELTSAGGRLDSGARPATVVEFSDYECTYCEQQHRRLTKFLAEFPDVGIVYRHFPLNTHPAARGAARASICAEVQDVFRQMHLQLFESTEWKADTNWTREAKAAGVPDTAAFHACLASPETVARLETDIALANALGVRGTPTFVHRRGLYVGMLTDSALFAVTQR